MNVAGTVDCDDDVCLVTNAVKTTGCWSPFEPFSDIRMQLSASKYRGHESTLMLHGRTIIYHFGSILKCWISHLASHGEIACHSAKLSNKTEARYASVEENQWKDCQANPVLDNARSSQDAHTSGQRPKSKHDVDWYSSNRR